jgi:diguanylate cyclase (GGDEF)-like protein
LRAIFQKADGEGVIANVGISAISRRIIAGYLAMVLVLLGACGLFVGRQASEQNQIALASSRSLAASAVRSHLEMLGRVTRDSAVWDEAYRNLSLDFNASWADGAFGVSVWNDLAAKLQGAFLVDGYDRTRFGVWNGRQSNKPIHAHLGTSVRAMIDEARPAHSVVTKILIVDGQPKMVAAIAVRPTTAALDRPSQPRGVMIWVSPMDQDFTNDIARFYSLAGVHWQSEDNPDTAHLSLVDADGHPAGALVWQQERPGDLLIRRALLPLGLLIVLCGLAGIWQARQTLRAATMLNAEHERARLAQARADVLSEAACRDALTDLLNRRGLTEVSSEIAASAREHGEFVAAVVVDLDRFKPVNDSHGHPVGDEVLREVADRLNRAVRVGDAVARLGGDEFVILTKSADRLKLEALATRLIEALSFPCRCSVGNVSVGASVGMALAETNEEAIESLIRRADRALFSAKQAGRSQWRLAA